MTPDDVDPAIFGEILTTMLAAGASNEVVGKFALMFRNKHIAAQPAPVMEMGPVLEAFATTVVDRLQAQGGIRQGHAQKKPTNSKNSSPKIIRLRVGGVQTSVSLAQPLFDSAATAFGSEAAAASVIKQLALQAPPDAPRSNYMQGQLMRAIAAEHAAKGNPPGAAAVH